MQTQSRVHTDGPEMEFIVIIIWDHDEAARPHTYMLVLAVEVSQSAASPTMSNPVESWLKYLGWADGGGERGERWEGVRRLLMERFIRRQEN